MRSMPYYKNGRFYQNLTQKPESFLFFTLPQFLKIVPSRIRHIRYVPLACIDTVSVEQRSIEKAITWIGHSTFLIQWNGINILTDPIWGSPSFMFSRLVSPGIPLPHLPHIDVVLISHNHFDHMHASTLLSLKKMFPAIQILTPQGDRRWFEKRHFKNPTEYMWWERETYSCNDRSLEFTFLPANHWSRRGLFDTNRSLWGSWMISHAGDHIYFAGDSAYDTHFSEIAAEYNNISVALLPIGPCEPRSVMKYTHMDAQEAVQAFIDLKAHHFVPMHWGTFGFGLDSVELPIIRLQNAWHSMGLNDSPSHLTILKVGETFAYKTLHPPAQNHIITSASL